MKTLITLGVMLFLTACASNPSPYAKVGVGFQVDNNSDWYVRTTRDWQCDNPQAHIELGLEFEHDVTLYYHHQSWFGCGGPFNSKPELYMDHIGIDKKWGGK